MRKLSKYTAFFVAIMTLFSPCAFAKSAKHSTLAAFLKVVTRSGEKYENPKLKEELSKIKKARASSENAGSKEEFQKYNLSDNERNVSESCFAWLAIILASIIIIKIICANFKIPFDYDPNFENKHVPQRKIRNKKYKF